MSTPTLLPTGDGLRVLQVTNCANKILVDLAVVATSALCPVCQHTSVRVHSRYSRTLADMPWNHIAVQINVQARKFFCDEPGCSRRIFTEPLPDLAVRYARKTNRLHHALYLLGYALGGEAGARLAVSLGLLVSPNTLLRHIRQATSGSVVTHRNKSGMCLVASVAWSTLAPAGEGVWHVHLKNLYAP